MVSDVVLLLICPKMYIIILDFIYIHIRLANLFGPFQKKGSFHLPNVSGFNRVLFNLNSELSINGVLLQQQSIAIFERGSELVEIKAEKGSRMLVIEGEPIDEPIASYGPFVMNTNAEIKQTIDDFNSGKFGYLD